MRTHAVPVSAVLAVLLIAPVLSGCGGDPGKDAQAADALSTRLLNVRVLDVRRSDLVETVMVSGRLDARRATDVSTEESGVVQALPVAKGRLARTGEVIVALDRRLLDAERKSAEAGVTLRQYNEERTRTLFEANSVSKQEMLLVFTELEQAREAARIAQLRYERAAIQAPFPGIVADHFVEVGQLVNPGERVARLVDPFELDLKGSLTEREIHAIDKGAAALVTVDGVDAVVPAEVTFVGVEADPLSGKFPVELTVDNSDLRLRAGVVGRARVVKQVHRDAIAIPRDAIVRLDQRDVVFVIEGDLAHARPVELGAGQGMMVVVRSGLESGERIVVRGQRSLQPESRVAITEVATARDGSIPTDPAEVREAGNLAGLHDMLEAPRPSAVLSGAGGRR